MENFFKGNERELPFTIVCNQSCSSVRVENYKNLHIFCFIIICFKAGIGPVESFEKLLLC